jgi:hypothetical protein
VEKHLAMLRVSKTFYSAIGVITVGIPCAITVHYANMQMDAGKHRQIICNHSMLSDELELGMDGLLIHRWKLFGRPQRDIRMQCWSGG